MLFRPCAGSTGDHRSDNLSCAGENVCSGGPLRKCSPSGATKKELTQIHRRLYDAVESAGFSVSDLCEAVTSCSSGGDTRRFAKVVRSCALARKQVSGVRLPQLDQQPVEPAVVPLLNQ